MILFQLLGTEFRHRMIYFHRQLCLKKKKKLYAVNILKNESTGTVHAVDTRKSLEN